MIKHLRYLIILSLFISACSTTKYVPEGEKLYTGSSVKVIDSAIKKSDAKAISSELNATVRPQPNSSILGLRVKLWFYFKTRARKGFIQKFFSKFGEPPVYISQVDLEKNSSIMQNRLQNESYFQSTVRGDTIGKKKTAKAEFTVNAGPSYTIRNVEFPMAKDNSLDTAVLGTMKETLLKKGEKYNLDIIKSERIRIDARLKEEGFFFFAPEQLIIKVDSTIIDHQVDLTVSIKPTTPERAREIYTIRDIYVYPNYSLRDTSLKLDQASGYRWYKLVDPRKTVRPFIFANTVLLHPNDTYSRTTHNNSLNRFINLGPYQYVKNRFEDVTPDSPKLDVYYFLTPYKKKSLQLELLGRTTSASYTGSQINLNWKNRNAFKAGELLTVTLFASTDVQVGGNNGGFNVYQYGIQPSISWPRIISPFNFKSDNAYIPRTTLTLNYTSVVRSKLYSLNSFSGSFGYSFKGSVHKLNELNLLEITYVKPRNVSQLYLDSINNPNNRNPALKHVIDPQFTWGPSYAYTYDNTTEDYRTNSIFYRGKLSLSNNLYGIISGADTLGGNPKKFLGSTFNQYLKLETEMRFFHKLGLGSKFAARLFAGIGQPYGNSTILPYNQQFFIGGPNSLRGFRARSVGPGSVDASALNGGFIADQSGDIKLEANLEYRAKLFSIVYGALFADAGNVWNAKPHQAGGTFGTNFLKQMAVDAGFGLRFDATVLVLRTDVGFPLLTPYINSSGGRSVPLSFNNAILNIAIGYPF
ncbi:translocation and assembly module lipoprotein TamL [Mucilaginibacter pedocola]|uniref:Bacterial surface antigen (D15) domain-containing protein n=1 Tax=Mucilaginibacter pedocola TaxID=1792845 RepID=A0A1S9P647_9SPHI|nr:BamA/TamA family outer membrane protein [Mucilaginibacter pedocola]OOQ56432.1 hypothetical protein BC343_18450 [Mucilaginibacter pedocola]